MSYKLFRSSGGLPSLYWEYMEAYEAAIEQDDCVYLDIVDASTGKVVTRVWNDPHGIHTQVDPSRITYII
jgi:hypothetical protein